MLTDHRMLALLTRMHSSDLIKCAVESTSEEQTLADAFKTFGIEHYRHNAPGHASPEKEFDPKKIQAWMLENGFKLTIHATGAIVQGPLVHFFSCCSPEMNEEHLPSGSFLFTFNKDTGVYTKHPTRTFTATR